MSKKYIYNFKNLIIKKIKFIIKKKLIKMILNTKNMIIYIYITILNIEILNNHLIKMI